MSYSVLVGLFALLLSYLFLISELVTEIVHALDSLKERQ